ncbi:unnamed protein product [Bursaphelenchus xylophilus]|nr:unnamed protein product [Bursaphelenchus xylophilus]CAD5229725.1 unnamed protein product [Bursaphelenchus xylophilus]CAG9120449.1 unnamed protein product [Bursaphelenchus xylophilus]CAG9120458.1 unnamed protein product [Bursaphelenchus xylophilus]
MSERAGSSKTTATKKITKSKPATRSKVGVISTIAAALTAQGANDKELTPEAYKLLHGLCRAKQDCTSNTPNINSSITSIIQLNSRMQVMESWKKNHVKAKLLKIDHLWDAYSRQHPADAQAAEASIDSFCQSTRAKRQARRNRQVNEEVVGEMEVGGNDEEDELPQEEPPRASGVKTRGKPKSKSSAGSSSK